jgi:hypothetical protein
MITTKTGISILLVFFSTMFYGCKKKSECGAGTGGSLTIIPKMIHHTRPINGCTVYVKFNTSEFPGEDVSKYDLSYKADYNKSEVSIPSLNCGDYYIYAVGTDSLLDPTNWICKGGTPYSTDQKEGAINLNVYITEGD